ncbi:TorF family putative porin [Polaromonas sp.]|uniref:TorF family putative porin n=1 Tax=Polaromonas sp. TaxID=1869339 RepID=UPI002FC67EF8
MKRIPVQVAIVGALILSGSAFAQTAAPAAPAAAEAASPLSFNISLTSNYKFRGQDQYTASTSMIKPALQGGVDYAHASGFYVGNWNSTVRFLDPAGKKAHLEVDLYGGYKFSAGDVGFDLGAITYLYPGATKANTAELYAGAGYGPFSAKYFHTVSKGYFGTGYTTSDGRGTGYLNLAYAQEVMPKLTLKASVGKTMFKSAVNNAGTPDFSDYSIGATYDLGDGLALTGAIQGASKKNNAAFNYTVGDKTRSLNKNALLVTLTKTL